MMFVGKVKAQITTNDTLNNFVTTWLKTPYRYGGNTKNGTDCSNLTQKLYKEVFGLELPRVSWKQWSVTQRVPKNDLSTGDLVFFRSKSSPTGWHVGVYLTENYFVHASSKKNGVKISSLDESYYKKNYKGAGRIKKFDFL